MKLSSGILIYISCLIISCEKSTPAQQLIDQSIDAHGFNNLNHKKITFEFRNRVYTLYRDDSFYAYTRKFTDSTGLIIDSLINSTDFTRRLNDQLVNLDDEWTSRYSNSVNSVLYFFQLPYVLNDPAAIKEYIGIDTINGNSYQVIGVTFESDGGGKDYDDEFMYWINEETKLMDYFAYNYQTDGGGVRFREAINRQNISGLVFQDYINYEVEIQTPLSKIPPLLEAGKLKVLSQINNEHITVTPY